MNLKLNQIFNIYNNYWNNNLILLKRQFNIIIMIEIIQYPKEYSEFLDIFKFSILHWKIFHSSAVQRNK